MKTNTYVKELKAKTVAELQATNQLDNTSRIKEVRKNIARIQTVITEKANAAE